MAFNPFAAFHKNQKFWMAAILLVTMVTFIFCTGTRGDMQDRIIGMFRKRGTTIARVGSTNLTNEDLMRLRGDRNMVNEFMRSCAEMSMKNIDKKQQEEAKKPLATDPKVRKTQEQELVKLTWMQSSLAERMRKPRFFEGGVKLDDLIEFKTWQAQADRLGIRLQDEDVRRMIGEEFYGAIFPQQMIEAERMARHGNSNAPENALQRAITEEYRVHIAQLAVIEMQVSRFQTNVPFAIYDSNMPDEQRVHVTLAQMWKLYEEKRSEFDVTLIPVKVKDFENEVFNPKTPPDDAELTQLFNKYRTAPFDPASPLPSFQTPERIKVEFVMADPTPKSPIYIGAAKAKALLETTMPLVGAPLDSPVASAVRFASFNAGKEKLLSDVVEGLSRKVYDLYGTAPLGASRFIWPMAAHLGEHDPAAIASLWGNVSVAVGGEPAFGASAAWAGFLATATDSKLRPEAHAAVEAGVREEAKRRSKPYALFAASGATQDPVLIAVSAWEGLKMVYVPPQFANQHPGRMVLPLPVIAPEIEKILERNTAERWASRNLLAVKRQLDKNVKAEAIKRIIGEYVPKYNLTHKVTAKYYDRYDIDQAPELEPLRDSFEKYYPQINWFEKRDITPERMLKENDFAKLFFDNERFAAGTKHVVRAWPPDVMPNPLQVRTMPGMGPIDRPNIAEDVLADVQRKMQQQEAGRAEPYQMLAKAQKPILFWRVDQKAPELPTTLAAAKDRVLKAWKIEKARELKALPLAEKIAETLAKTRGSFSADELQHAGTEGHHGTIEIKGIAPLVPKSVGGQFGGGHREYFPFKLPRDKVDMPRDDMVTELLELHDLKKPIEIKTGLKDGEPTFVKMLNDLNKRLFDLARTGEANPQGKFVQVLTNRPQTVYYVAVISSPPKAKLEDFQANVFALASEARGRPVDTFFSRAQELIARDFRAKLLRQLREDLGGYDPPSAEERARFDNSSDQGS